MTVSHRHEYQKHLLGLFLIEVIVQVDIDVHGGGSMTFKREDLERSGAG